MAQQSRYELIAKRHSARRGDLADQFAAASAAARESITVSSDREAAIRDIAAGVAAPTLVGCVLWTLRESQDRRLRRLRFLSRDGQIFYELARRLAPRLGTDIDLAYAYSSRLTWSLAATNPQQLSATPWLFNSFMKSNAGDVCSRLGLSTGDYLAILKSAGVSLDPEARADQDEQLAALRRFLDSPDVARAASDRITSTRALLIDYARQNQLSDPETGLVDAGWTGRMVGSLVSVCEPAGMARPHVLFWGHEPRVTGWTDPDRVAAFMYNTATGQGLNWRVPDAPFIVETFCMGDHGIVAGYEYDAFGKAVPVLSSSENTAAKQWGLELYRSVLYAFCDALDKDLDGDVRPLVHEVMDAFWCHPTATEACAWGGYPYDSDPAGTAVRPLARPFPVDQSPAIDSKVARGDRAWIAGSLALSDPAASVLYSRFDSDSGWAGAPAAD